MNDFIYVAIVFALIALAFAIGFVVTHLPATLRRVLRQWHKIWSNSATGKQIVGWRRNFE